jgi:YVTN family beta-propeller protein
MSPILGFNTVTVIDGGTLNLSTVTVGAGPRGIAIDPVTNRIYVTNINDNTMTMIDGATNGTFTIPVGKAPGAIDANVLTNQVYVANYNDNTVSIIAGANASPLQFVAVAPCRVVDTRKTGGAIPGGTSRDFSILQSACSIPSSSAAFSLNVTVVPPGPLGYLTIWPTGEEQPAVSTMNSSDGRTKANAAIVPVGYIGEVSVFVSNTTDVVLDIDGYFAPADNSTLAFYPLLPCRVADTRNPNGDLGGPYLTGGVPRGFPILESNCGIPNTAQAYSLNFTAVPHGPLGYLTVWPAGQDFPPVSTLNAPTGTVVANAAIVQAGLISNTAVFASNDSDLVIDVNGYFDAPGGGGLSLYPTVACRVIDTRRYYPGQPFMGEWTVYVVDGVSVCAPPSTAQAYVFNATVVPSASLGYLTLWPDGSLQPGVSTLNAIDGAVTSNMAIVPNFDGRTDAFASDLTQLVLDVSAYFAP